MPGSILYRLHKFAEQNPCQSPREHLCANTKTRGELEGLKAQRGWEGRQKPRHNNELRSLPFQEAL